MIFFLTDTEYYYILMVTHGTPGRELPACCIAGTLTGFLLRGAGQMGTCGVIQGLWVRGGWIWEVLHALQRHGASAWTAVCGAFRLGDHLPSETKETVYKVHLENV